MKLSKVKTLSLVGICLFSLVGVTVKSGGAGKIISAVSKTSLANSLFKSAQDVFTSARIAAANALARSAKGFSQCRADINPASCYDLVGARYRRQGDLIQTAALSAQSAMFAANQALSDAEKADRSLNKDSLAKAAESLKTAEIALETAEMALSFIK